MSDVSSLYLHELYVLSMLVDFLAMPYCISGPLYFLGDQGSRLRKDQTATELLLSFREKSGLGGPDGWLGLGEDVVWSVFRYNFKVYFRVDLDVCITQAEFWHILEHIVWQTFRERGLLGWKLSREL